MNKKAKKTVSTKPTNKTPKTEVQTIEINDQEDQSMGIPDVNFKRMIGCGS